MLLLGPPDQQLSFGFPHDPARRTVAPTLGRHPWGIRKGQAMRHRTGARNTRRFRCKKREPGKRGPSALMQKSHPSPLLALGGAALLAHGPLAAQAVLRPEYETGLTMARRMSALRAVANLGRRGDFSVREGAALERIAEADVLIVDADRVKKARSPGGGPPFMAGGHRSFWSPGAGGYGGSEERGQARRRPLCARRRGGGQGSGHPVLPGAGANGLLSGKRP